MLCISITKALFSTNVQSATLAQWFLQCIQRAAKLRRPLHNSFLNLPYLERSSLWMFTTTGFKLTWPCAAPSERIEIKRKIEMKMQLVPALWSMPSSRRTQGLNTEPTLSVLTDKGHMHRLVSCDHERAPSVHGRERPLMLWTLTKDAGRYLYSTPRCSVSTLG